MAHVVVSGPVCSVRSVRLECGDAPALLAHLGIAGVTCQYVLLFLYVFFCLLRNTRLCPE